MSRTLSYNVITTKENTKKTQNNNQGETKMTTLATILALLSIIAVAFEIHDFGTQRG